MMGSLLSNKERFRYTGGKNSEKAGADMTVLGIDIGGTNVRIGLVREDQSDLYGR